MYAGQSSKWWILRVSHAASLENKSFDITDGRYFGA